MMNKQGSPRIHNHIAAKEEKTINRSKATFEMIRHLSWVRTEKFLDPGT